MAKLHVSTTINGEPEEFLCEPDETMLDALRNRLGLTGSKEGCGSGDCGACSITLDGTLVCACLMLAAEAEGAEIGTIEGMAEGETPASAAAEFPRNGGPAMRHLHTGHAGRGEGAARREPGPDRNRGAVLARRQSLPVHGLRQDCPRGASYRRGNAGDITMNEMSNKWIGQRTIRPDGADKVTGRAAFAADTAMSGMIWGKVLRSPHPHARIRGIDTSKAEALAGVKAVVTAADIVDFPVDTPVPARHPGHALDVPQRHGAREGAVPRPSHRRRRRHHRGHRRGSLHADRSRLRGAALGHRDRGRDQAGRADPARLREFEGKPSNISGKMEHTKGDVEAGFAEADVVDRAQLHHPPGASGLYRAAGLPRQRRRRRQDDDLELEPGPVHGARHDVDADRPSAERHPRNPGGNRRRLRRQDHHLSRAGRHVAGEEIRPAGEDGDDPRGGDAGDRPDLGLDEHGKDRRQEGRAHRRRRRAPFTCRPAPARLADPRRDRLLVRAL